MARTASSSTRARRARAARRPRKAPASSPRRRTASARRRARDARARRLRVALVTTLIAVPVLVIGGIAALVGVAVHAFDACRSDGFIGASAFAPVYDDEQLGNAAVIVAAGRDLGLSVRDQTIGVMTAMGESSLRNIDYGDWETSGILNPDGSRTTSIGLFQQQDGWGSREQRLDPYTSATLFYRAMMKRVPDPQRQDLEPTIVAHRTQVNSDPEHYARYWPSAVQVVETLSDGSIAAPTSPVHTGCLD
jgi:hypothetical protein